MTYAVDKDILYLTKQIGRVFINMEAVDVQVSIGGILSFIFTVVCFCIVIASAIFIIAGMWKMFEKAGEPGWASIIPFMNMYKLCKISLGNGLFFLLFFVPIINFILFFIMCIKLAGAFGKGILFGIATAFFPGIFYAILGFGSSEYHRPKPI